MRPIFLSKPLHTAEEPPIKNRSKTAESVDCSLPQVFFFLKIVRLPLAALTIRRPKHPVWQCCTTIFHGEIFEDWSLEILIWNTIDIYTASNDHTKFSTAVQLWWWNLFIMKLAKTGKLYTFFGSHFGRFRYCLQACLQVDGEYRAYVLFHRWREKYLSVDLVRF